MNDHYGNATGHYGDPGACMRSVYQALSPPPLEGPGNEAIWRASPFPVVKRLAHQTNPTCPPRELLSNRKIWSSEYMETPKTVHV